MINADESSLFDGMVRWGIKECERRGMDSNQPDRQRPVMDGYKSMLVEVAERD